LAIHALSFSFLSPARKHKRKSSWCLAVREFLDMTSKVQCMKEKNCWIGRKYPKIIYLTKKLYLEYFKELSKFNKKWTKLWKKSGQKMWTFYQRRYIVSK
jgi:hypothetical protein